MLKLVAFLISFVFLNKAYTYESMIRLGYASCITCHHSQTGGGLLNDYGRVIAAQLSSFSETKNPTPSRFDHGVQGRMAHFRSNGQTRNFPMQLDYLNAFKSDKITIETTIAKAPRNEDTTEETNFSDEVYLRKGLVTYRVNNQFVLQGGRDYLDTGLNMIDHTLYVRNNNRRGVTDFFSLLRGFYQFESGLRVSPTLFAPSFQESEGNEESGLGLKLEKYWTQLKMVATLSLLRGETDSIKREEVAITFKMGWKYFVFLTQFGITDREIMTSNIDFTQQTALTSARLFPLNSLELYLNYEWLDVQNPFENIRQRIGPGFRWRALKYLSLEFDAKRETQTNAKFQTISQLYFNWSL